MIHMRPFTQFEIDNFKFISNLGIRYTTFQTYWTSLDKGYFDAIAPMRTYFLEEGIHDYASQGQGQINKEYREAYLLTDCLMIPAQASLYRPCTKKGDPRIWFSKLKRYTNPDDIFALFHKEQTLYIINVTQTNVKTSYESSSENPIKDILSVLQLKSMEIATELLGKFRKLYDNGHWYEAEVQDDTGIGRAVETLLGIPMNSDPNPDYKGIELKSKRLQRSGAKNGLFSQIPDWEASKYKNGNQIVQKYGYVRNGNKTLQVTVQANRPNAQSLVLDITQNDEVLEMLGKKEVSAIDHIVEWQLMTLHNRLKTKHKETFWISVDNKMFDGKEFFKYSYIEHTRNPNIAEFDNLIMQQLISLELLLNRPSGRGDTWNFKIKDKAMPLLFPESFLYKLDPNSEPHRGPIRKRSMASQRK
jgi:hypothetical protein